MTSIARFLWTAAAATLFGGCYVTALTDGLPRGASAPRLEMEEWLNTEGGAALDLDALRGNPILVEFWSQDCPPCVKNLPRIKRIEQGYAEAGLKIVTVHVSLDKEDRSQDAASVKAFVEAAGIRYPVAIDQSGCCWEEYSFDYLPHGVLLDAERRVIWSGNLLVHDIERVVHRRLGPPSGAASSRNEEPIAIESESGGCAGGVCRPS